MPKFRVRVSGTAPVWKDVEVEADSAQEALDNVIDVDGVDVDEIEGSAGWDMCEGGNGVDDWTATGYVSRVDVDGAGVELEVPVMEDYREIEEGGEE